MMQHLYTDLRAALLLAACVPFNLNAQKAYIPNGGDDVAILDVATNTTTGTITLPEGSGPVGVAFSLNGQRACIANYGGNTVSIVDVENDVVLTTIPAGTAPQNAVFTPDGSTIYVISSGDNTVLAMDATTYAITATIPVGQFPIGAAITPDGSTLYVADGAFGETTVNVISTATNTVTGTITVGDTPAGLAITPDGSTLYVANNGSNTVSAVSTATNTVTATIDAGAAPNLMAVHPDGSELYVAGFDNFVAVVSTATNAVIDSIPNIEFVLGLAITPDGSSLYALTPFAGAVVEVNTATHSVESTFSMTFPNAIGNFIGGVDLTTGITTAAPEVIGGSAFPNPFSESTTLRFEQELTGATVQVIDALGRTVRMVGNVNGTQWTLDRSGLPAGLYTVRVARPGGQVLAIKVTIE